jgi:NAD(P)-dependent dehydrogenase (short-subunit alcohol dehydrogenase family)
MSLKDKTAIVTGAGRGLGRAIALGMAAEGARVVLVSRSKKELEQVADTIGSQGGVSHVFTADVAREEQVGKMVADTLKAFSTIDVMVNNAGVIGPPTIIGSCASSCASGDWTGTIDINLNGASFCTRAVIPAMQEKKPVPGGRIVNIVSGLGNMAFPRFCAYAASKAGLIQMTRSLSLELEPFNIQVNAVDPGVMNTDMQKTILSFGRERLGDQVFEQFLRFREQGHLKDPGLVARLVVFLASSAPDHVTGKIGTLKEYENLKIGFSAD